MVKIKPNTISAILSTNSQVGTPKATLAIMATGEVNGMIDSQKLTVPSGSGMTNMKVPKNPMIMGKVIGKVNCCASEILSTAEPTAANKAP